jgi:hypothetical protein
MMTQATVDLLSDRSRMPRIVPSRGWSSRRLFVARGLSRALSSVALNQQPGMISAPYMERDIR